MNFPEKYKVQRWIGDEDEVGYLGVFPEHVHGEAIHPGGGDGSAWDGNAVGRGHHAAREGARQLRLCLLAFSL